MVKRIKEYLNIESELLQSRVELESLYKSRDINDERYNELIVLHDKVANDLGSAEAFIKAIRIKYNELTNSTLDNETLLLMVACVYEGLYA